MVSKYGSIIYNSIKNSKPVTCIDNNVNDSYSLSIFCNTLRKILVCYNVDYVSTGRPTQHYEADLRHFVAFKGAKGCKVSSTV